MIKFIAVILAVFGVYTLVSAYQSSNWVPVSGGVLCLITTTTLWLKKPWSKYLVYFIGTVFTGEWLWVIWSVYEQGWPYTGALQTVIALIPGLLMVIFALGSMVVVHRAFPNDR